MKRFLVDGDGYKTVRTSRRRSEVIVVMTVIVSISPEIEKIHNWNG